MLFNRRLQLFYQHSTNLPPVSVDAHNDRRLGSRLPGPAIIVEDETATLVTAAYDAIIDPGGSIILERRATGVTP